jgi:hypothetical protein
MQGRFKMEYRLFTIVRYNYRDCNSTSVLERYYYRLTLVIPVGHSTPPNTLYHNLVVVLVLCTQQLTPPGSRVTTINRPRMLVSS